MPQGKRISAEIPAPVGRIEAGEAGVAIGHVLGLLAQYGVQVTLHQPNDAAP